MSCAASSKLPGVSCSSWQLALSHCVLSCVAQRKACRVAHSQNGRIVGYLEGAAKVVAYDMMSGKTPCVVGPGPGPGLGVCRRGE